MTDEFLRLYTRVASVYSRHNQDFFYVITIVNQKMMDASLAWGLGNGFFKMTVMRNWPLRQVVHMFYFAAFIRTGVFF